MIDTQKPNYLLARQNMAAVIRYMIFTLGIPKARVRLLFDQALEDVDPEIGHVEA